ncbi:MAG TPA: adenine deaminase C-terminal domain-containing protein, partial [Lachnospiraceae bacterium]|nr:adenine deaminase C-terminal domain-containing protein [Lachnospiraceae bacterium]
YCLVKDGEEVGSLPLRVGGLMSDMLPEQFIPALDQMLQKAADLGVASGIDPFITLSFIALPVIPSVRLTDEGMFDVDRFCFFAEGDET